MDTIAYIDCSMGVSGDLLLSALLDAGLAMASVQSALALAAAPGTYQIESSRAQRQGLHGTRFSIVAAGDSGALYSLAEWEARLQPGRLREPALACLRCLVEAEAAVSTTPIEAIRVPPSTLCEILAVLAGLHELAPGGVFASSLPLTSGVVERGHHFVPVLSPVTLEILRHHPVIWQPGFLPGELVTPVAAALLATCARFDPPPMSIERTAYGLGATDHDWPGALRLCLGRSLQIAGTAPGVAAPEQVADTDWVAVIETHFDTMTGELLGGLMERLFAVGALDVTYTPIQMKKNRPATLLTVICPLELGEQLALLLLRETTTLGVRIQHIRRLKAQREQVRIETELGAMLVKVKRLGDQLIHASPEYEECQRLAKAHDIPLAAAYEVARTAIKNAIIDRKERNEDVAI
ncbi:LarC family nickel insertion protein [Dictyobacter formicarum]|uniref:TIGR00299 family protein n=1 Tax=Dictyobacter formicarum TaxID=2778368 RepID=A0ABQ3VRQ9_9CHLR|nr:LarC family nickel insertion protein [Dictyobacter formicarum]GHO88016.1 TIGR00299 family protein [Dictyobacter formicarum]